MRAFALAVPQLLKFKGIEGLTGGVQGIVKKYDKPFSKTDHEGLGVADFHLGKWKDGKVTAFSDAVAKSITPADLKR